MLAILALWGCPSDEPMAPGRPRADVVTAPVNKPVDVSSFCESRGGQAFALPETEAPVDDPPGWTWVNVWATWCGPCVAEMPMLVKWKDKLSSAGVDVTMQFLSVDAKPEVVTAFLAKHPEIPKGPRIREVALLEGWLTSIGLDASAVLPVHLFVDPQNTIRCVRMGAIAEYDYDAVKSVLQGK